MSVVPMLHDTHIVTLLVEPKSGGAVNGLLRQMGAKVYTADNQAEAIGLYWRLYRSGIRPRAVITSWLTTPPDSKEFHFLRMLGREVVDGTSLNLLVNISELDETALCAVYTRETETARKILSERNIRAEVYSRLVVNPAELVVSIATHAGIATQRLDPEEVRTAIRRIATQSACEIPAA